MSAAKLGGVCLTPIPAADPRPKLISKLLSMLTRRANDWTPRFCPTAAVLATLPVRNAYLERETTVLTADGIFDFGGLQEALDQYEGSAKLVRHVLHLDGRTSAPAADRKEGYPGGNFRPSCRRRVLSNSPATLPAAVGIFFALAQPPPSGGDRQQMGSGSRSRRSADWVKVETSLRQEFILSGYAYETNSRRDLGSLMLGHYNASPRAGIDPFVRALYALSTRHPRTCGDRPPWLNSIQKWRPTLMHSRAFVIVPVQFPGGREPSCGV
jgi:hypothetical protein